MKLETTSSKHKIGASEVKRGTKRGNQLCITGTPGMNSGKKNTVFLGSL